jgi:protease-4
LAIYVSDKWQGDGFGGDKHTALVDIRGVISMETEANADYIASGLRAAFEDKNTAGVILRINSPGGSPVQSGYVNDEIRRLRLKYPDIPLYAVIGDLCASGGYYIASAADQIYADKASLVGSIGVIMSGFGFVESIKKLGVERRVRHAGKNKAFLDPFSPQKEEDVAHIDELLDDIYQQFIETVKQGRGDRLVKDEKIFSGLIWTGEQSLELGLVDALGSSSYVAREVIGVEDIVDFTYRENYLDRFAGSLGASIVNSIEMLNNYQLK